MNYLEVMKEYSDLGSWAIWESTNRDNLFEKEGDLKEDLDFGKYINTLQKTNCVILGMNPGGIFNEENARKVSRKTPRTISRPWNNFHNIGRSRDYLLAQAIKDTPLRGSYMTDILPIVGSKSKGVKEFINAKGNSHFIQKLMIELDSELSILLPNDDEVRLFCLGKDTEKWADNYLVNSNLPLKKSYKVFYLPHYSGANRHVSNDPTKENYYPKVIRKHLEAYGIL